MSRIGKLNTRIQIKKRREIGKFSNEFEDMTGGNVQYDCVLDTWAEADYVSTAKKYNGRAVGNNTGGTAFVIRNPLFELDKDHYIDAMGYRYKVEGTMPLDGRHRFIVVETIFVGLCSEEA